MNVQDEQGQLRAAEADLVREFADRLRPEAVDACFRDTLRRFDGAPIRTYVPVLATRLTRQRLRGIPPV